MATTDAAGIARLHLRATWLCALVLFLEGYDVAAVGFALWPPRNLSSPHDKTGHLHLVFVSDD